MSKTEQWFYEEAKWSELPHYIWVFWKINIKWIFILLFVQFITGFQIFQIVNTNKIEILDPFFPFLLFAMAFWEEVLFRLPIYPVNFLVGAFTDNKRVRLLTVFLFIIPMSAYFGYLHGSMKNILIQGFGGILFSFIFMKFGGIQNNLLKALVASTSLHVTWNASMAMILLLCGGRTF